MRGILLGVPVLGFPGIRTLVFGGFYIGASLIWFGNYHIVDILMIRGLGG